MTDPALPGPEGVRPELLAAYVDGELAPEARAAVEAWLAAHSEALEALLAQRQLGPGNWPLWQQAEPPLPTADNWAAMRERIADALTREGEAPAEPSDPSEMHNSARQEPRPPIGAARWKWITVTAAMAASLLVAWFALRPAPQPEVHDNKDVAGVLPPPQRPDDPLAGYAVLPIAAAEEVDVQRVVGDPGGMFAVGGPPLDGPLVLATEDEVELEVVEDHPAWPTGVPVTVPTPGDAPMIYAPRPR